MRIKTILFGTLSVLFLLCSCGTPKKIAYLQDAKDGDVGEIVKTMGIKVQPEDKISIVVNSKDAVLSEVFNLPAVTHRVGSGSSKSYLGSNQSVSYYTVAPDGTIDFPVLGKVKVEGMSRSQINDYIKNKLISEDLIKDPVVITEFINTGISVMGEVNHPGRYDINKDRLTVLEALSMAGDLTIQGQRENVLVVREIDGKPHSYRLDLTDGASLYSSPAYYLQQNDIVYVEPNNMKKRSTTVNGNNVLQASFWVSIASLLTSISVLIFK